MSTTTSTFKVKLADKVSECAKITLYGMSYPQRWYLYYLCRMNIVALDRNNEIDVLTDEEVQGMTAFLNKNL